jgi:hypothetical protein
MSKEKKGDKKKEAPPAPVDTAAAEAMAKEVTINYLRSKLGRCGEA